MADNDWGKVLSNPMVMMMMMVAAVMVLEVLNMVLPKLITNTPTTPTQ